MYSVKRISVQSAAKVAFIVLLAPTVLLSLFVWANTPFFGTAEQYESRFVSLLTTLAIGMFIYGALSVLIAMFMATIYNATVRLHGGIKLDLEFEDNALQSKAKN